MSPLRLFCLLILCLACSCRPHAKKPDGKALLAWNQATLIEAYRKFGHRDAAWNRSAERALKDFAELRSGMAKDPVIWERSVGVSAQEAVDAGCPDPLIKYLQLRFPAVDPEGTPKLDPVACQRVAEDLKQSGYPPIRKYYALLRTSIAFAASNRGTPPEAHAYRRESAALLAQILKEPGTPLPELEDAAFALLEATERNEGLYKECFGVIEKPFFEKWGKTSSPYLVRARYHHGAAWKARGTRYADSVTEAGWKIFGERMTLAERDLEKAWQMETNNVRVPNLMIEVAMAQSRERPQMEIWFERAMAIDPNNYRAAGSKLFYLQPKWHGTQGEMLEFGRQCLASTNWGGRVPLILADARYEIANYLDQPERDRYWRSPEVWNDIRSSFERVFASEPDSESLHQRYALLAYWCDQWGELNRQLPLLGKINYKYFGGQAAFEKMVRLAREHAAN